MAVHSPFDRIRAWVSFALILVMAAAGPAVCADARWAALATPTFRNVGQDEGLPSADFPTSFAQDGEGFVWLGTQGGLLRWDGDRFRAYRADRRKPGALPDGFVDTLHTDPTGRLWIGTDVSGLVSYDRAHDRFVRWGARTGLDRALVDAIADDGRGGLWVGGDHGLDHLDPASGRLEAAKLVDRRGAAAGAVTALLLDRAGALWVATGGGLFRRGADGSFTPQPLATVDGAAVAPSCLYQDVSGRIWIGTTRGAFFTAAGARPAPLRASAGDRSEPLGAAVTTIGAGANGEVWLGTDGRGVFAVDVATLRLRRIQRVPTVSASLGGDTVAALFRDRSGLVWAATDHGFSLYNPAQDAISTVFPGTGGGRGLTDSEVAALMQTPDGHVWLGLHTDGVEIFDPVRGRIGRLRADDPIARRALPHGPVYALTAVPKGPVYIATRHGLYRTDLDARTVEPVAGAVDTDVQIHALADHEGVLWVGSDAGLTGLVLDAAGLPTGRRAPLQGALTNPRVYAMTPAPDGALWVGTHSGLNRVDRTYRVVERLAPDPDDPGSLSPGGVTSLVTDRQGRLWIGSTGGGVDILVGHDALGRPRLRHIGRDAGLPHINVDGLLLAPDGAIWASTDDGLARIDPSTLRVTPMQAAEGLHIFNYYNASTTTTAQGELLFGGQGGLTIVDPRRLRRPSTATPVVITEAAVGGGAPVTGGALANAVTLRPGADRLRLEFAVLDYWAPDRTRYAYRLEGYDPDWITTDATRRSADYANLAPGRYTLRLRGSDHAGAWTQAAAAVPILVIAPWWRTWTFAVVALAAAIAAVFALVQGRTRYLRRRQRELERQVADRTQELVLSHRELEKMAYFDVLTGLPNRRMFTEDCRRLIAQSRRHGRTFALLLIDLDRFKIINDTLGHDAGDALLKEAAARLQTVIRESDHVARVGGDEFAILLGGADPPENIETVCRRLIEAFAPPTPFRDSLMVTSPSVGVAIYDDDGETEERLYKNADLALYAAKRAGRNTWRRYEPAMAAAAAGDTATAA